MEKNFENGGLGLENLLNFETLLMTLSEVFNSLNSESFALVNGLKNCL